MVLDWNEHFSAATVPRRNETRRAARPWGGFTYTLLPLPLSSSCFFLFSHSSEFWPSFSLINGATQVAHSGLHPARASLRATSWRQQGLCCILTALVSPWVKTDEMGFVFNLDAHLFAFCHFSWRKTKQRRDQKKKKGKRKWRTGSPAEKCFGLRGKSVIGGLGGSLHCMSRRIIAGGSALAGDCGSFQNTKWFLFYNFKHDWTPSTNCTNTTSTMGSRSLQYCSNLYLMNAAFASTPECLQRCLFQSYSQSTSGL